ncbi:prepilin peptidase [Terrisporobacter sp.]|uniref:prepilin peptidase n=1 Tax=Terrisporobacter sp. TaxID=1965305 RepID=UPI002618E93B|nr:A24 family peptidase [Terrisporobacter sp.]
MGKIKSTTINYIKVMIYFILILIFIVLSFISEKIIYILDKSIDKNISNKILILLPNMIVPILIYTKYELNMKSISFIMLIPFLTLISIIDYKTTYVYDITILSGIIMQGVIFIFSTELKSNSMNHLKGLLIGIVLSYIVSKITKSLGEGDVWFYGLCCFVIGKKYALFMMYLSIVFASIYGLYIIFAKKGSIKSSIPFTPFISLATVLVILTQWDIMNLYFDILRINL